jgi:hypothetical protein
MGGIARGLRAYRFVIVAIAPAIDKGVGLVSSGGQRWVSVDVETLVR